MLTTRCNMNGFTCRVDHDGCCYCKLSEYNLKDKGYELKLHYYFAIL